MVKFEGKEVSQRKASKETSNPIGSTGIPKNKILSELKGGKSENPTTH